MQTKKNLISILFSAFIFLMAPVWYFFIAPELIEIPDDFSYTADIISFDNFYDEETSSFKGEQKSATIFSYNAVGGDSSNLEIENIFDVRKATGEPIFSVRRLYGIDAHSKQHVSGLGDRDREGYLFAPRMKGLLSQAEDKSSFKYWHVNYDVPITLDFVEEEEILGLNVYHYRSDFNVDQTSDLTNLPEVGETLGIDLDVDIDVWIEPATGYLVKYKDSATAYYYSLDSKERIHPWNNFRNYFDSASVNKHVIDATIQKQIKIIVTLVIPVFFMFLAFFVFLRKKIYGLVGLSSKDQKTKNKVWVLPFILLTISMTVTLFIWNFIDDFNNQQITSEFLSEVEQINDSISDRLDIYINALNGGRGLFDASDSVSREEWKHYVESLKIEENYPGIQGFGYSIWLSPDELESHIKEIQDEGFPEFSVRPEGERENYTSIIFLEPFDERNRQAFGFDMFQEITRRTAMVNARDSGESAMSGKVTLVQEIDEDVQSGFLMYIPVYAKDVKLNSPEERKEALVGFVYSPFRMNNFINGALFGDKKNIIIEVFDGLDPENLSQERKMYGDDFDPESKFVTQKIIERASHGWTVRYSANSDFNFNPIRNFTPLVFLSLGIILSILIFFIVYIINTRRVSAMLLAESMTSDLKKRTEENEKNQKRLEVLNKDLNRQAEELSEKIKEVESINKHMVDRELKMIELKKAVENKKKDNQTNL